MFKKDFYQILPVIILALAIALSPSFSAGQIEGGRVIEIRIEDILLVILGILWIINFLLSGRIKIEKPPLLFPILAWLGIGFFSVLTNWIFMNLGFSSGFFFFLKEVEFFFLYFYLFYHLKNSDSVKLFIKIWIFLGLINVGWIVYQMITGFKLTYYYGPTPFIEPEGPLPAGGFFLILFIFFFNISLHYYFNLNISKLKKGILNLISISPIIGVFGSGSRASFLGFILALILTLFFYSLKNGFFKSFLIGFLILIFFISISIFSQELITKRFLNIKEIFWNLDPENPTSRTHIWIYQLSEISKYPFFFLFGLGKSVFGESHNQYLRNFIETGFVGSLIFFILISFIIKKSWQGFSRGKESLLIGLSSGLLVATLTLLFISFSSDAFIVVKINEVYWFFVALTLATLSFCKTKSIYVK